MTYVVCDRCGRQWATREPNARPEDIRWCSVCGRTTVHELQPEEGAYEIRGDEADVEPADETATFSKMLSSAIVAFGVILLLGAAGYWLMTRRGCRSAPGGQLAPWE